MDFGPIVLYSHFNALNPSLNVIDTTTEIFPTLQAGEIHVRVGMTSSPAGRTVFVDGLVAMSVGSANVALRFGSPTGSIAGSFQAVVATNTEPPGSDLTGAAPSVEYPTPVR